MRDEKIILSSFTLNELQAVISDAVQKQVSVLIPFIASKEEFISRKETASILGITLPTLSDWTKKEIVTGYRIASRIRYKKEEILASLTQVKTIKYGGYKRF